MPAVVAQRPSAQPVDAHRVAVGAGREAHLARGRPLDAGHQPGDGGLAAAALADQRGHHAAAQVERHVPDRLHGGRAQAAAHRVGLDHPVDRQHRRLRGSGRRRRLVRRRGREGARRRRVRGVAAGRRQPVLLGHQAAHVAATVRQQRRVGLLAGVLGVRAAGREQAARVVAGQVRRAAGDVADLDLGRTRVGVRAEQTPAVRVPGVAEHQPGWAVLDDLAAVHHHDPVGHLQHRPDVVADEQHGEPQLGAQRAQPVEDVPLHHDVQAGGRLVEQHQLGPQGERQRQRHPLLHAAGQLVRIGAQHPRRQRHHLQERDRPVVHVLPHLVRGERVGELRLHPDHRVERVHAALEDRREVGPAQPAQLGEAGRGHVDAVERDGAAGDPAGRREQPQDRVAQGGLAAARLAEQADELALGDVEGDLLHGARRRVVARCVRDTQVANFQQCHVTPPGAAGWTARRCRS